MKTKTFSRREFAGKMVIGGLVSSVMRNDLFGSGYKIETDSRSRISEYADIRGFNYQPSWGSNDDDVRASIVRDELAQITKHQIGFLPHGRHHSWVADLHRPVSWQTWETKYMGFIDPDHTIRHGHEIFNEF